MMEKNVLNEEELNKVVGGGSGNVPEGGMAFTTYSEVIDDHFYSRSNIWNPNYNDVYYVYLYNGLVLHRKERITVKENRWSAEVLQPSGTQVGSDFISKYPYVLNVRPE